MENTLRHKQESTITVTVRQIITIVASVLISAVGGYMTLNSQVIALEVKISEQDIRHSAEMRFIGESIQRIETDLREMRTDVREVRKTLKP